MRLARLAVAALLATPGCKTGATAMLGAGVGVAMTGAVTGIVGEAKTPPGAKYDHVLTAALIAAGVALMGIGGISLGISEDREEVENWRRARPERWRQANEPVFRPRETRTSTLSAPVTKTATRARILRMPFTK